MYKKKKKTNPVPTLRQIKYRCCDTDRLPQCVKELSESMGMKLGRRGINFVLANEYERIDAAVIYAAEVWGRQ